MKQEVKKDLVYIKLESDMSLVITENNPIYRGDNLNQNVTVLVPTKVGNVDMLSATVYMPYIRADGTAEIDLLTRDENAYQSGWLQYTFPVNSKLSRYPGMVCMWLTIYSGPANSPVVAKSGECMLQVHESTCMDEYVGDRCFNLIYQIQQSVQEKIDTLSYNMLQNAPVKNIEGTGVVISSLPTGVYNIIGTWKMTDDDEERPSADDDLFYVLNNGTTVRLTWVSANGTSIYEVAPDGTVEDIQSIDVPTSEDYITIDGGNIGTEGA